VSHRRPNFSRILGSSLPWLAPLGFLALFYFFPLASILQVSFARDEAGLARECAAALRDGFSGKLAIHPAQVPIINEGLTPSAAQLDHARRVVAAFAASGDAGVTALDGRMLDRPHLFAAQRILGLAAGPQPRPVGLGMRKSPSTTA